MDRDAEIGTWIHQQLEELINQRATPLPAKTVILCTPNCPGGRLINLVDISDKVGALNYLVGHGEVLMDIEDYRPVRSLATATMELEPEAGEQCNRQLQLYAQGMLDMLETKPLRMEEFWHLAPRKPQPFWTKDWRRNGRKH